MHIPGTHIVLVITTNAAHLFKGIQKSKEGALRIFQSQQLTKINKIQFKLAKRTSNKITEK